MLETIHKKIIDENIFLISFIDKNCNEIDSIKSNEITSYKTNDGSEIKMALRVNAVPPSILVDLKIKYPSNFYNPNNYELLDVNEKKFQDFYNEVMGYNPIDYEMMDTGKSYTKEF